MSSTGLVGEMRKRRTAILPHAVAVDGSPSPGHTGVTSF
jgi:hypothetical protein